MFWRTVAAAIFQLVFAQLVLAAPRGHVLQPSFFGTEYTEPLTDATPPSNLPYGTVRLNGDGMEWGDISTSDGTFTNWTAFDQVVAKFKALGKKIHYVVGNQDAGTPTPPSWVNSGNLVTEYASWCDALLAHAGSQLDYVTVWNEADTATIVGSASVEISLAQTLFNKVQTYNTANGTHIKVVGPTVTVPTPGSASDIFLAAFLQGGGGSYVDIVDFHAYVNSSFPYMAIPPILNIKSQMVSAGIAIKPLWMTEFGTSTINTPVQDTQIAYQVKLAAYAAYYGLSLASYFSYNFANYNMWTSGGGLNYLGNSWVEVNAWLQGAYLTSYGFLDTPPAPFLVEGVGLRRGTSYQAMIIWTNNGVSQSYTLPGWVTQYTDITGTVHTGLGASVTIGSLPILLQSGSP